MFHVRLPLSLIAWAELPQLRLDPLNPRRGRDGKRVTSRLSASGGCLVAVVAFAMTDPFDLGFYRAAGPNPVPGWSLCRPIICRYRRFGERTRAGLGTVFRREIASFQGLVEIGLLLREAIMARPMTSARSGGTALPIWR